MRNKYYVIFMFPSMVLAHKLFAFRFSFVFYSYREFLRVPADRKLDYANCKISLTGVMSFGWSETWPTPIRHG